MHEPFLLIEKTLCLSHMLPPLPRYGPHICVSFGAIGDLKRKTLQAFIAAYVKDGFTVKCDGYQAYNGLKNVAVDAKASDSAPAGI